jgi:DNA-binding MarR family transcriptional regulator
MLDKLQADGLVRSTQAEDDRRVRTIELTKPGQQLVAKARRTTWREIEAAVADACAGSAVTLLPALAALEEALAQMPLSARIGRKHAST